jgi:CRISPR-associated protein Cas2
VSRYPRPMLICYDIADPKRLRKAFRDLKDVALPVQKSVFVGELTEAELDRLLQRLGGYLDPQEDRVQVFMLRDLSPLRGLGQIVTLAGTLVI